MKSAAQSGSTDRAIKDFDQLFVIHDDAFEGFTITGHG